MPPKALSHVEFGHYTAGVIGPRASTGADWQATACGIKRFEGRDFSVPKKKPDTHFKIVTFVDAPREELPRAVVRVRSFSRTMPSEA